MRFNNVEGSFGSDERRNPTQTNRGRTSFNTGVYGASRFKDWITSIPAERWIDIVCCSLIGIGLIVIFCTWNSFMDSLFLNVLFPVIYVGSRILGVVLLIVIALLFLYFKLFRYRRWF